MFIDDAYKADPPGPDGMPTGHYRPAGREREIIVQVETTKSVSQLGKREKDNRNPTQHTHTHTRACPPTAVQRMHEASQPFLYACLAVRLAAERTARAQSVDSEMIVFRSEQYHKRMNLMGDLACYGCWAVHLRTPKLDIGVIACRRKFIPPVGDQYQACIC